MNSKETLQIYYDYLVSQILDNDFLYVCGSSELASEQSPVRYYGICSNYFQLCKNLRVKLGTPQNQAIFQKLLSFKPADLHQTAGYVSAVLEYDATYHDQLKEHILTLKKNIWNVKDNAFALPQILIALIKFLKALINS